ncbi:phosphotransferase [Streptomyces violascens]|uniref:phosphotransferase n=1 Tax=Streptomyces violascens TaxID=67381 RepID=UPI0016753AA7|nr:phosphotransferase [Streptomyces violascens]GGU46937.1 hypothetical protein GCM10010289_79350 [Streptomyces violascens]
MDEVKVVVAHSERVTLRVGDVFLKVDADQARIDAEVEAMSLAAELDAECEGLVTNGVLPAELVTRNRQVAEAALRPWTPAFTHGDLQIAHVFVDGEEVTGIIDWSEAGQGDALYDLATFTLGHQEHLEDVIAGYGTDLDVIHAWWSLRSLLVVRWLIEHGFDPFAPGCEVDVLRSRM